MKLHKSSGRVVSLRVLLLFVALAAVGACLAIWLVPAKTDDGVGSGAASPRFVYSQAYRLTPTGSIFRAYEDLRLDILRGKVGPSDLPRFRRLIADPQQLSRVIAALDRMATGRCDEVRDLYGLFIRAEPNSDVLYAYLNAMITDVVQRGRAGCRRGHFYAWSWGYLARASLIAYQATSQSRFLELFAASYEQILADRDAEHDRIDEMRGRVLRSWGTCNHVQGKYTNVVTIAGRIAYPIALFCRIVRGDEALESAYGERAARYLASVEAALAEFDADFQTIPATSQGYYGRPTRGDVEPLNHAHSAGEAFVLLYELTGAPQYRRRAEHLAKYFISAMRLESNGSRTWSYQPTPENRTGQPAEAVWKAQITIQFPLLAHAHGIVFDDSHMQGIVSTFRRNVHRGGASFNTVISADDFTPLDGRLSRHCLLLGWMVLDRFDPEIRVILEKSVADRLDVFGGGWFQRPATAMAYSHRLRPPQPPRRSDVNEVPDRAASAALVEIRLVVLGGSGLGVRGGGQQFLHLGTVAP